LNIKESPKTGENRMITGFFKNHSLFFQKFFSHLSFLLVVDEQMDWDIEKIREDILANPGLHM